MQTTTADNPNAQMYANEAERQRRARQGVEERATATAARVKAQIEEVHQPTLTQLENDLAAVGVTLPDPAADTTPDAPGAPRNRDVPMVSPGTGAVGESLSCTMGNWENEPSSYAYQWKRDGHNIPAAHAASYVIAEGDAGHSLTCVVTATNARGATAAPPSNAVLITGANGGAARRK
jgi:hypothetical protein